MHRADNLTTFMCQMSRNSGSLNHLQPEGFFQACNGIALVFNMDDTFNFIQVPFALED